MSSLTDLFFSRPDSSGHKAARTYALIAAMFLAGGVHWILFFDYGRIPFEGGDWPKEHLYYQVLQEAVQTGTVPYHVDQQIQTTHRFLALPEKVLSPQILLLRFLDVGQFVMANTLVMYAVGFWGASSFDGDTACRWSRSRCCICCSSSTDTSRLISRPATRCGMATF
jgi:hypothetical protein